MENKFIIEVGGEAINLGASGKAQLVRLAKTTKFIDAYGRTAMKNVQSQDGNADYLSIIVAFIGGLDEEGLILLGEIVTGKDKAFVEEHFDLTWVIEGVSLLLQTPALGKIRERFFGNMG